jgi:hypothetical protein
MERSRALPDIALAVFVGLILLLTLLEPIWAH